jgi:hypothetical protein
VTEPAPRQVTGGEYRERLRTPWWWYPIGIVVGVLLGAEFDFVMPQALVGVPVLLAVLVAIGVVWRISSGTVRVASGRVIVGERSLPVTEVDRSYPLSYAELRRLVGRHGDPLAFTYIRPWVGPGVQLVLTDTESAESRREPYWVLSSRHPDQLLAAVQAARSQPPRGPA